MTRLRATVFRKTGKLRLVAILLFSLLGIYAAYVVKSKVGVDLFSDYGLHLLGPRTLVRQLAAWVFPG